MMEHVFSVFQFLNDTHGIAGFLCIIFVLIDRGFFTNEQASKPAQVNAVLGILTAVYTLWGIVANFILFLAR